MRTAVKIFLFILPVIIFTAFIFKTAVYAQSAAPQMVVTWQAYGSYVPPKYGDKALPNQESRLTATLELISNGKLNVKQLITHRLPLQKIQEGFKLVTEAKESLKVVLEP